MDPTVNNMPVNVVNMNVEMPPNKEELDLREYNLTPKMSETDFAKMVKDRISDSNNYWSKFKYDLRRIINYKYWVGEQLDRTALRDDQEKNVENAIFRNIETLIPIVTSRTPELSVTPAFKNDITRQYGLDVKRISQTEWEVFQHMQKKVGQGVRNHQMEFIAVFQLGYDPDSDEFWTEQIPAHELVISKNGDFVARYIKDRNLGYLLDTFPEKKQEIMKKYGVHSDEALNKMRASPVTYLEAWTDELVGWKLDEVVLGIEKNPHFDYNGDTITIPDPNPPMNPQTGGPMVDPQTGTPPMLKIKVKFNHFKMAKKPFLFLTYFNRGVHLLDDTTLIEQSIGPQDWINKRKRQIGLNADSTNGHWVSSGDYISQEEFDKVEGSIDEKIWLENGNPSEGVVKITGEALPDYIYTDLQDSRSAMDNLMGTHNTTRGEKSNNNTLGQDVLQKDQDYGRVDGYVRDGIEVLASQWYEYMYQLYLVYRTKDKAVAIPQDSDIEDENVIFSRDRVPLVKKNDGTYEPVPLVLRVKQGSTLPMDDVAEYQKAQEAKDIMSPIDYFKKIGEANPRQLTKNFLMWSNDPFSFFKNDKDMQELQQNMASRKGGEPPKVQVRINAEADTPAGAALLGEEGLISPPAAQMIQQEAQQNVALQKRGQLIEQNMSAANGGDPTQQQDPAAQPGEQPAPQQQPQPQGPAGNGGATQGIVNAMTALIQQGKAPPQVLANVK